jgi:hypothetical protein
MSYLNSFHDGTADMELINREYVIITPKTPAAVAPGDFHPISLQGCPVKLVGKVRGENRIGSEKHLSFSLSYFEVGRKRK